MNENQGAPDLPPTLLGENETPELVGVDQTMLPASRSWARMDNGQNSLEQAALPPGLADLPPELLGQMPPELLGHLQNPPPLGQTTGPLGYIPTYALFIGVPAITAGTATFVATRSGGQAAWGALGGALGGLITALIIKLTKKEATF